MKTSQIVLTSLSVLGVAGIGYAFYFDHRRRNDAAFRKSLRKESKKSSKADKKAAAKRAQQEDGFIQDLLHEVRAPGTFPADVEEREQFFLKYVSLGEQLFAMGADKYLDAAAAFFKALKVYPQPVELIMIYQKAVPKEVFDTIMRIVSKDIATGGAEGGAEGMSAASLDEVDDDGPSPAGASAAAPAKPDADEDDDDEDDAGDKSDDKEASTSTSSAAPAAAPHQQGTDSGTTSSQEWDTLSATSLNETGVIVTPNAAPASTASSQSPEEDKSSSSSTTKTEEPKLTSIDTSAAATAAAAPSTPSKQNFTSDWSPAPVFGASSPRAEKKASVEAE
ncbi:related to mitochondrial import receptor subunit TOM20 [Sporisorium reilianum f. sp. reilianum]|uniref:Mitochondrial import receptor subunit TOM20 n=1 Tax=Sporisorium reilianum f. sp. reilianum TaxID=72559 RepID=A0A2N8U955_9BASI|nr:related to mitochondrial import receptor subunit TOM20 [Sporisorium reilianum f. sp. reilianum]